MSERQLAESRQVRQCRICLDAGSSNEPTISPCDCRGSIQYVHISCIKQYVSHKFKHSNSQTRKKMKREIICEICHHAIPFLRVSSHKRCASCEEICEQLQFDDIIFLVIFGILYLGFHAVGILIIIQTSVIAKILGAFWLAVTIIGFNYILYKIIRKIFMIREAEITQNLVRYPHQGISRMQN